MLCAAADEDARARFAPDSRAEAPRRPRFSAGGGRTVGAADRASVPHRDL